LKRVPQIPRERERQREEREREREREREEKGALECTSRKRIL
jgi:hypothetical protein